MTVYVSYVLLSYPLIEEAMFEREVVKTTFNEKKNVRRIRIV